MDIRVEKAASDLLKAKPDENSLGFGQHMADHMFVMKYDEKIGWHDAAIKPYGNFSLDPAAMVLHYSQEIFEGLKAYRGKDDKILLFRPTDNLKRMNVSAARMCMPEIPTEDVYTGLKKLISLDKGWVPKADGATLYIRPAMIAAEAGLGVRPARQYIFFIITCPVGAYYPEGFNPVKIFVTDKYVRAVVGGVGNVKTGGNYAASIMAAVEAQKLGYTQVLWLDAIERRYIEEVGTSNIFFLIDDELITPPLSGSILPGITRDSVLRLTRDWGLKVSEKKISIDDVLSANENGSLQEVFGTGTAAVISPVGEINYKGQICSINKGKTGGLAQKLFDELQAIQNGYQKDPYNWMVEV